MTSNNIDDSTRKKINKISKTNKQSKIIQDNLNEEYLTWFSKAEGDLRKTKILINAKEYDGALFFAQQSAEKALKALHIFKGFGLIKTHDLPSLCKRLKAPDNIFHHAIYLNPFGNISRYPDQEDYLLNKDTANEALKSTQEILKWCKQ